MRAIAMATWMAGALAAASASAQETPATAGAGLAPAPGRFVAGVQALAWWMKASPTPAPLLTDGVLGAPGTQTFLGGGDVDTGTSPGVRGVFGYGLRAGLTVEGNLFYIPKRSTTSSVSSTGKQGSIDIMLPYIDATTGRETVADLSLAPVYRGSMDVEYSNEMWGGEINGAWSLAPAGALRLEAIGGLRYLRLDEKYAIGTQSPYNPPFPADVWQTSDSFATTNDFYGVQAGLRGRVDQGAFFAGGSAKLALGAMVQKVTIDGSLVTNDFNNYGTPQTYPGGYFALPSNMGTSRRTAFAAIPEITLDAGWRITPTATLTFGYSFLYVSSVARPGNQIDRTLDTTQSIAWTENPNATPSGAARPSRDIHDSSFWAQGVSLGLAVSF